MNQRRALVIDDNRLNLKVLSQMLAKQGLACVEVSDPAQLETMIPTLDPVDVVFLDLEMPGIDGYVVKDILREHLGNMPIIAYTVHVSEMNNVHDSGFDGFVGKPLDSSRFPDQLARILNGEPVWERA